MGIFHENFSSEMKIEDLSVIEVYELERGSKKIIVVDKFGNAAEFLLRHSPELRDDVNKVKGAAYGCKHPSTEIRFRINAAGQKIVSRQCVNCGENVGKFIKKEFWPDNVPAWDQKIFDDLRAKANEEIKLVYLRHIELQQSSGREYDQYLRSEAWKIKRMRVLQRDKHLCQGCLVERATEVHHLDYRNVFNEFMFQLVSLCSSCHERLHADQDGDD